MPQLAIITGANGAGKSTIGKSFLPSSISSVATAAIFDGDKLFMQKQKELWQQGIIAIKEAKKLAYSFVTETFDQLVEKALNSREDFAYEGHFTNDATWEVPKRFKEKGYELTIIFMGLTDPDLSEMRVIDRSEQGGHYVSRPTIEDNFYGNLEKLDNHFIMFDNLFIIDSSGATPVHLLTYQKGKVAYVVKDKPIWLTNGLPTILELVKK